MRREKAQAAPTARPKVPMRRRGADCSVVVMKRGGCNARGAKGAGHRRWVGSTGNGRNLTCNGRRRPSHGGTSRMMREYQVRICERLGVQFPGPTRRGRRARRCARGACPRCPAARLLQSGICGVRFGSNAAAWWGFHYNDLLTEPKPREVITIYEIDAAEGQNWARAGYNYRWVTQTDPFGVAHRIIDYPGLPVDHALIEENHQLLKGVRIPVR